MSKASISVRNQLATQSQEGTGVDIRNPSTAFLGLSANDRYPVGSTGVTASVSPYNCTLSSSQNLLSGYFTRIGVTELDFTWCIPTITSDRNDSIIIAYQPGGVGAITNYTITIPAGWYTPTTLAAAMQTAVRTATGNVGFTLAYASPADPSYNYVFLAASNNTDLFEFQRFVGTSDPDGNRITLFEMMNWNPATTNDGTLTASVLSGVPTMLNTPFVDFVCSYLTQNQGLRDGDTGEITRSIITRLYLFPDGYTGDPALIGSQPFRIVKQFSNPKQIKWSANQPIGNLTFQVFDSQGYPLGTRTGVALNGDAIFDANKVGWNMSLLVSEV